MTNMNNADGARPPRRPTPSTPRWVIAFGIVAVILVIAFFVLHLTGMAPTDHGM